MRIPILFKTMHKKWVSHDNMNVHIPKCFYPVETSARSEIQELAAPENEKMILMDSSNIHF